MFIRGLTELSQRKSGERRGGVEVGGANSSAIGHRWVGDPGHLSFNGDVGRAVGIRQKPLHGEGSPHRVGIEGGVGGVPLGIDIVQAPDFSMGCIGGGRSAQGGIVSEIETEEIGQRTSVGGVHKIDSISQTAILQMVYESNGCRTDSTGLRSVLDEDILCERSGHEVSRAVGLIAGSL